MPLAKRKVSPVRLSCKPVADENKFDFNVVCNNTLVGALQQLASLAFQADELFAELGQECVAVVRRTNKSLQKVQNIKKEIEKLDFRTVKIPAGDLKIYKEVSVHYQTEYGLDALLFTPSTRPDCIIDLYEAAALSPVRTIRQCNGFRKDGRTGSKLFSLTPVVKEDALYGVESVVDISGPLHYGDFERKPREPKSIKRRPRSLATLTELDNHVQAEEGDLPPMETEGGKNGKMSASTDLVPIDVTGSSFARMCEYRESMRSNSREYIEDETYGTRRRHKHRRRQTVSGLSEHSDTNYGHGFVIRSQVDLRVRSVSRERLERPKSMAYLDRYAPKPESQKSREELRKDRDKDREEPRLARSCSLRRSMKSLFKGGDREKSKSSDLWVEGRPESPGPPMVEIDYPLRRSKSLPRSLKSISKSVSKLLHSRSASTEGRLDSKHKEEVKPRNEQCFDQGFVTVVTKRKRPKGLRKSLTQRMSRSQSHMSHLGTGNVNTGLPPKSPQSQYGHKHRRNERPKSLDFGAVPVVRGPRQSIPVCTPTTPSSSDRVFTPSSDSGAVGMKHRINIPSGQAWKAFGGVKYRGQPNGCQERHSSSGNWSATDSSARFSTESDYPRSSSSTEHTSQISGGDRDSAISFEMYGFNKLDITTDNNPDDDASTINGDSTINDDASTLHEDSDSTLNGSVVDVQTNSKQMSDAWLNSLSRTKDTKEMKDRRRKRRSRKDRENRNKGVMDSPSGLTLNNLRAHDDAQNSNNIWRRRHGDEESSVYSQDTDGFYTSMHIDSGLKSLLLDNSSGLTPSSSIINGADYYPPHTLHGVTVPITLHNSSKTLGINRISVTNGNKKIPPPPPKRTSTLSDKDNRYPSPASSTAHMDELDRLLAASSFSLNSTKSNDSKNSARLSRTISDNNSTGVNESAVSESDTEVIYIRVKNKTNISSAGYPSLCSVTPLNSEDEDTDMLGFSHEWRSSFNSNISSTSAAITSPNPMQIQPAQMSSSTPVSNFVSNKSSTNIFQSYKFNPILEVSRESSGAERSLDESGLSLEMDISGMDLIDTSIYSTWPRNPKSQELNTESGNTENAEDKTVAEPDKAIGALPAIYVRSLRLFNVGSLEDIPSTRDSLPEVKTPDGLLDNDKRTLSKFSNTFHIPSDHKFTFDTSSICALNTSMEDEHSCVNPAKKIDFKGSSPTKMQLDNKVVTEKPPVGKKLNTSQSSDMASFYATHDYTSTWPRKRNNVSSPKFMDDSGIDCTKPYEPKPYELDENSWTNSLTRRKKKLSLTPTKPEIPKTLNLNKSFELPETLSERAKCNNEYSLPVPAQARLIISSPVSNHSEKVDNPHKRSLCSPVSNQDFVAFSQFNYNTSTAQKVPAVVASSPFYTMPLHHVTKSNTMFEFPSSSSHENSAFRPVSKPLYPSINSMKHSLSFPEPAKKQHVDSSTCNRSWYDSASPYKTPSKDNKDVTVNEDCLSQTGYPFAAFLNDSFLSTLESGYDSKRQSVISNNSTGSSGSGKKSVTFASDHKNSQSSLNKSDSVSVGSNHTENSSSSRAGLAGILTSFKKKSVESIKSFDSGKSNKSNDSVKLRSGKTIEVDVPEKRGTDKQLKSALSNRSATSLPHSSPERHLVGSNIVSTPSPLKLKRSSALLDDDFDVHLCDVVPTNQENVIEKLTRPFVTEQLVSETQHNAKRQCTSNAPKIKSPGKIIVAKKSRLRRAPSKTSVTVVVNADSCEVVNMPISKTDNTCNVTPKSPREKPFSSIIMNSAPSKVSVSTPFDLSSVVKTNDKPVVISAGPARTSKIITGDPSKAPGAVVNLLHIDSAEISKPEISNEFENTSEENSRLNNTTKFQTIENEKPKKLSSFSSEKTIKGSQQLISHTLNHEAQNVVPRVKDSSLPHHHSDVQLKLFAGKSKIPLSNQVKHDSSKIVNTGDCDANKENSPDKKDMVQKAFEKDKVKSSAFDTGHNVTNVIKPTPPKFVLPKLRTIQTTVKGKPPINPSEKSKNVRTSVAAKELNKSANETSPAAVKSTTQNVNLPASPNTCITSQNVNKDPGLNNECNMGKKLEKTKLPYSGSTTSLHQINNGNSLGQSNVLTKSLSNLSCLSLLYTESTFSLSQSSYSLAKSTDSLASTSSIRAERTRMSKMAFLEEQQLSKVHTNSRDNLNDKFAKYSLGLKTLSQSKTSLNNQVSDISENNVKKPVTTQYGSKTSLNNNHTNNIESTRNENVNVIQVNNDKNSECDIQSRDTKTSSLTNVILTNGNTGGKDETHPSKNSTISLKNNEGKSEIKSKLPVLNKKVKQPSGNNSNNSSPGQGNLVSSLIGKFQK